MTSKLSDNTRKLLNYIYKYQKDNGFCPTIGELKLLMNTKSTHSIQLQLNRLSKQGFIKRERYKNRAIKILFGPEAEDEEYIKVPIVGQIEAGYNTFADYNITGSKFLPLSLLRGKRNAFILEVSGHSMKLAGIFPGDKIVVVPSQVANNNDIVVAYDPEDDCTTLKRYKKINEFILLIPETDDPTIQPKISKNFVIQAKYVGKVPEDSKLI